MLRLPSDPNMQELFYFIIPPFSIFLKKTSVFLLLIVKIHIQVFFVLHRVFLLLI